MRKLIKIKKQNETSELVIASEKKSAHYDVQFAPRAVARVIVRPQQWASTFNITVGEGAGVDLLVEDISKECRFFVKVNALGHLVFTSLLSHSGVYSFHSEINLLGQGAQANQQLVVLGSKEAEANLNLLLYHKALNTHGRINIRRVQTGDSNSAVYGLLKIAKKAFGTDTYLSDKAILLSPQARAISVPSLEILADDVKASHGSTVGKVSSEDLFYLRSRGLPIAEARQLLLQSFIAPALVGVPEKFKQVVFQKLLRLNVF